MPDLTMRPATADDLPWLLDELPRLLEFGPPQWRTIEQMNAAEAADLTKALNSGDESTIVLIACTADDTKLGFVYVRTLTDFFTGEEHGHISAIVVTRSGEGQGVGRALLSAAEQWSKSRRYRFITLSVFPGNRRALGVYEHAGYSTDVLRMLKLL